MPNKYALSDQTWDKDEAGYVLRSIFKMKPSVHVFNPQKKYLVALNSGPKYTGVFKHYIYRKETMDSPLVRVYIELTIAEGTIIFPEDSIQTFVRVM